MGPPRYSLLPPNGLSNFHRPSTAPPKALSIASQGAHSRAEARAAGLRIVQSRNTKYAARAAERREASVSDQCDVSTVMPYGGVLASASNLASTTLGSGLLGIPHALYLTGSAVGILYLIAFGALTIYSYTLLGIAGMRTGYRQYGVIVNELMGTVAGVFAAVCIIVYCFSCLVAYVMSVGLIFQLFFVDANENLGYFQTDSGVHFATSMLWLMFMLPLGLARSTDTLKYFSTFAISMIGVFVVFVIIHACRDGIKKENVESITYFETGNAALSGLSSIIFAYASQITAYSVFEEQYEPSVGRLTQSATVCVLYAGTLYLLMGVFGYLDFGPLVSTGSALRLYHPNRDPMMTAGYVFLLFKLFVSYGLHMVGLRESLYFLLRINVDAIDAWKHALLVTIFALASLLVGMFYPQANKVLGTLGGTFGGIIAYVLPALMAMYTGDWSVRSIGLWHYMGSYALLVVGVVAIVFSTVTSLYGDFFS